MVSPVKPPKKRKGPSWPHQSLWVPGERPIPTRVKRRSSPRTHAEKLKALRCAEAARMGAAARRDLGPRDLSGNDGSFWAGLLPIPVDGLTPVSLAPLGLQSERNEYDL